ncbi:MAG: amidohydrolase family protein [Bacteroidota bacterium]
MKKIDTLIVCFVALWMTGLPVHAQIAVKGEKVYTSAGAPIENGVVLIKNGKIDRVGPEGRVNIPSGYKVMEAAIVTPGFIDAHTTLGLTGITNQSDDQDVLDRANAIQPELRAIDAYNGRDPLVAYLRDWGITTVHTGHGPGALISGQTMIVKTYGETIDDAVLVPSKMLAFTMTSGVRRNYSKPGTRSKGMAMLRQELIKAQTYLEQRKKGEIKAIDLKKEALADLLEGKLTALVSAHKANDIMTAVRLKKEFGFSMVLDGAAEAYLVMDELKSEDIPVVIHPARIRAGGDAKNASFETAYKLDEAGIPVAFQSGYEAYVPKVRVVSFEAAINAANGLGMERTLELMTIGAANLLGIQNQVGSLETGKDADVVLFDGDPFEYTTHVTGVIVNGKVVKE